MLVLSFIALPTQDRHKAPSPHPHLSLSLHTIPTKLPRWLFFPPRTGTRPLPSSTPLPVPTHTEEPKKLTTHSSLGTKLPANSVVPPMIEYRTWNIIQTCIPLGSSGNGDIRDYLSISPRDFQQPALGRTSTNSLAKAACSRWPFLSVASPSAYFSPSLPLHWLFIPTANGLRPSFAQAVG